MLQLFIQSFFFLLDSAFLALYILAAVGDFPFRLQTLAVNLVLSLQDRFLFLSLRCLDGFIDKTLRFLFGRADFRLGRMFSMIRARNKGDNSADYTNCDGQEDL